MKRAIFLVLLLSLVPPTWAAQWIQASVNINGTTTYVDVSSLYESKEGYIMYWAKQVFKNKRHIPEAETKVNGQKVWYSKFLTGEDCRNGLTANAAAQYAHYNLQDQVIASGTYYISMVQPIPETAGEETHKFVCAFWDKFGRQD